MKKASLKLQPVEYPVYHAISELNRTFAECVEKLEQVMLFDILPPKNLRGYQIMVEEIKALVNQDIHEVLDDRELNNSAYYEHLRLKWQGRVQEFDETPEDKVSSKRPKEKRAEKKTGIQTRKQRR